MFQLYKIVPFKFLTVGWLSLCVTFYSKAQINDQITFHNLDAEALGVKAVTYALQSHHQNKMWLRTNVGLGYYNGFVTKHYPHIKDSTNCPLSNKILDWFEDKQGRLWFGYEDVAAISYFDPADNSFKHFEHNPKIKNSFPNTAASRFFEDSEGRFFVTTWGGGLLAFNKERTNFELYTSENSPNKELGMRSNATRAIMELSPGKLLVGYFHEQPNGQPSIFDVNKKTFTPFPIQEYQGNLGKDAFGAVKNMVTITHFFHKDNYNRLWIGTYSGLVYFDLKNKTCKRVSGDVINENSSWNLDNTINHLADSEDRLWVTTTNSGILLVDLKTATGKYLQNTDNCSSCVGSNSIRSFTEDADKNIWVTNSSLNPSIFSSYKNEIKLIDWKSLKAEFNNRSAQQVPINHMHVRGNNLYLSNKNGISVFNYRNGTLVDVIKPYSANEKEGSDKNSVGSFTIKNNILYFGLHPANGLPSKYDLATKKLTSYTNKEHCHGILFSNDTSNRPTYVLSYFYNNLCYYGKRSLDTFHIFNKDKSPMPFYSERLANGKWFFSSDRNSFIVFDSASKKTIKYGIEKPFDVLFKDTLIQNYYYNKKNTVWICSARGISSYDIVTGKVSKRNAEIGISETALISCIVEDKNGDIWFASGRNFFRCSFDQKKLTSFDKTLGIPGYGFDHFFGYSTLVTDGKVVALPSVKGLIYFDVDKINLPNRVPKLSVFDIHVNDTLLNKPTLSQIMNGKSNFSHTENNLVFELSTDQLFTPSATKFKYQLLGLSDKWVNNESSNKIVLQNLPSGNYTLVVECENCYKIKSAPLTLPFTIDKPFWQTWWFILTCIAIIASIIIYIVKLREAALQKRQAELEKTVTERTQEVVEKANEINHQKELIEEKQKEIVDSIKYAQRIQKALLASKNILESNLRDYFIFFNPKDLVSGDFYWATEVNNKFYFIVADSTGHGVPGAFMSLLNISYLNEAINERGIEKPGDILNYVRQRLITSLSDDGSEEGGKDGMDCSLLCFDFSNNTLDYSCAYNPIVIIRNNAIIELTTDRMPVGKSPKEHIPFATNSFTLEQGDTLYALTDGYADQFGGASGKKLKYKNLKQFLLNYSAEDVIKQEKIISQEFSNWKGKLEQIDDVTIVGIKI